MWGVWDRRDKCWAERPLHPREAAERIAAALVGLAAGFAEAMIEKAR